MSEGFEQDGNAVEKFTNALIDSIPVLGQYVDVTDSVADKMVELADHMVNHVGLVEGVAIAFREKLTTAIEDNGLGIKKWANMTEDEVEEWADSIKESIDKTILGLEDLTSESGITATDFKAATQDMKREAQELARAMREISKEKWIPDEYVKFLSEQGPEWTVAFTELNRTAQERAVENWETTRRKTDEAKESLDKITGVLKDLDNGTSKHTVIIDYQYTGFDPTKPGMREGATSHGGIQ